MFSKVSINNIPIEETPHASGSRKLIAAKENVPSDYFEAMTYGYLPSGEKWLLHEHQDIVEICIVVKGSGVVRDLNGLIDTFNEGDRFVFPPNTKHEIENTSENNDEFYFVRVRSK